MNLPQLNWHISADRPYAVSITSSKKPWAFVSHTHKGYCDLTYVKEGEIQQKINGKNFVFGPGALLWTRTADVHDVRGRNFIYVNLIFPEMRIVEIAHFLGESETIGILQQMPHSPFTVVPIEQRHRVEENLNELMKWQSQIGGKMVLNKILLSFFVDWFAPLAGGKDLNPPHPTWLSDAIRFAGQGVEDGVSLKDLWKKCGRSPEHISRSFRKYLGITPSMFLNNLRLDNAAMLLMSTNQDILDICFAAGFSSPGHFYKLFSKKFGIPPKAYRAKMNPMWHRGRNLA